MRRFVLSILFILAAVYLTAWTLQDCVEVGFDHPDCDRYTTTTTGGTSSTTSSSTTSTPQPTTSTSSAESTTTSTPSEQSTTTVTPTTTIAQCPPGMIHQPPLCVPTTVPFFDTTTVPDTTAVISPPEELPRTGPTDLGLLALAGVSLLFLGFTALKYGRREE